jgi:hypothetical protein
MYPSSSPHKKANPYPSVRKIVLLPFENKNTLLFSPFTSVPVSSLISVYVRIALVYSTDFERWLCMVWRKDLTKVPFEYNIHLVITTRVVERRAGLEAVEAAGYGCTGGG